MTPARTIQPRDTSLDWLLSRFVSATAGCRHAIVVSSDGLPVAVSDLVDRVTADQFAAITSGLVSLAVGAATCFDLRAMHQVIVEMAGGFLFVTAIRDGSALAVVAERTCDIGLVGYEMTLLAERAGSVLTPDLVAHLRATLPT